MQCPSHQILDGEIVQIFVRLVHPPTHTLRSKLAPNFAILTQILGAKYGAGAVTSTTTHQVQEGLTLMIMPGSQLTYTGWGGGGMVGVYCTLCKRQFQKEYGKRRLSIVHFGLKKHCAKDFLVQKTMSKGIGCSFWVKMHCLTCKLLDPSLWVRSDLERLIQESL